MYEVKQCLWLEVPAVIFILFIFHSIRLFYSIVTLVIISSYINFYY